MPDSLLSRVKESARKLFFKCCPIETKDALTELPNRRAYDHICEKSLSIAKKERRRVVTALVLIDIDGFKQVNDKLGHSRGDSLLQNIAEVINPKRTDDEYFAARHGGDEFALIISKESLEPIFKLLEKIKNDIAALDILNNNGELSSLNISASIGVTLITKNSVLKTIQNEADKAMYCAKGRVFCDNLSDFRLPEDKHGNRIVYYDNEQKEYFLVERDEEEEFKLTTPKVIMNFNTPIIPSTRKQDFETETFSSPYIFN